MVLPYPHSCEELRICFQKEKIKTTDFFFPKVCLTSILQNSFLRLLTESDGDQ